MIRWNVLLVCASVAAICILPAPGLAQAPPNTDRAGAVQAEGPPVSREVLPDRRVTFRLNAPRASQVALNFQACNAQPQPMTKYEKGVWSTTVGPVEPEIYSYTFLIDGVRTPDPLNSIDKNGTQLSGTQFEVPGTPPRFDELQNVPHGSVNIHFYTSSAQERQRAMYIYVPPSITPSPRASSRCCTCGTVAAASSPTGAGTDALGSSSTTSSRRRKPCR